MSESLSPEASVAAPPPGTSAFDALPRRRRTLPRAWRSPFAIVGAAVIVLWAIVAVFAPLIEPHDPLGQVAQAVQPPSAAHPFGTDLLGRDILSRVIAGSRISLPAPVMLVVASLVIGVVLGLIAGYFGRVVDEVIMRITDLVLAFPSIILAMIIVAATGPGIQHAMIAIIIVNWPQYTRVTRSLVLGARSSEYVVAGRLMGANWFTSLTRDILPNIASPVLVLATLDFGNQILALAGLSFLGLGAVPPQAEWGSMVYDGLQNFSAWWIAAFPALAIFTLVIAFNLLGDALRDALDPRMQERLQEGGAL
ncbi:ABC transporter permease [Gryllotalpicola ginsengisoli]|uniref:ABC transporter permease n=1 Tax=Gryllotalpicola ginsengisoli TaxID=444608 RepID=UPI0003B4A716|nr:ABC transporter permease [Gryllotalpicola ginsengisoli]